MPQNIEIKARIGDVDCVHSKARALSGIPPQLIKQEDIFFHANTGRLKLRILSPSSGELISYDRADLSGPKVSTYHVVATDRPDELRKLLAGALGEKIIVRKLRHLYLVGRTRIHVDQVEGLGDFIELEVVLEDNEALDAGEIETKELMQALGISPSDLVEGAYADLLILGAGSS